MEGTNQSRLLNSQRRFFVPGFRLVDWGKEVRDGVGRVSRISNIVEVCWEVKVFGLGFRLVSGCRGRVKVCGPCRCGPKGQVGGTKSSSI